MNKLCECGCGKEVKFPNNRFLCGHNKSTLGLKHSLNSKLKNSLAHKGRIVSEETKQKISKTLTGHRSWNLGTKIYKEHKQKISLSGKGRIVSEETKQKISSSQKGRKRKSHTPESKLKISQSLIGHRSWSLGKPCPEHVKLIVSKIHKNKSKSETTKLKMRLTAIRNLQKYRYPIQLGKNEKEILDKLQTNTNLLILRNDNDIAKICGKFPDGYIKEFNLCIEVLEPHHFTYLNELSNYDKERELIISSYLSCMIYYIPEQKFLSNPDKEIERFKNFIELLRN